MVTLRPAHERGTADYGWLKPNYSFSFADYYDPKWMGFRSLRVINEDTIAAGGGFPTHPHRDMEIITVVIDGALAHRDLMDGKAHEARLAPGRVQRMSAGSGIRHSEYNASQTDPLHLMQIWIEPEAEGLKPRYDEKDFPVEATGLTLLCSRDGRDGSLPVYQDADLYLAKLEAGGKAQLNLRSGRGAWVQVISGDLRVNGTAMKAGDGAAVEGETALAFEAQTAAQALVFDLA